ncbi:uncharacterized protein LOC143114264 [Alosa pseudoharengus]|uniref:uncharacterized protein LOC143114264 n=1 Tax=Alosa pseudoharengus TaxID=34774 RepID=UPI003F8A8EF8
MPSAKVVEQFEALPQPCHSIANQQPAKQPAKQPVKPPAKPPVKPGSSKQLPVLQPVLQPPPVFSSVLSAPTTSYSQPVTNTFEHDQLIFRALEEIKAQVRQNTLLLQALAKKQPAQAAPSLPEEFTSPIQTQEHMRRVENVLLEKTQEKAMTTHLTALGGMNAGDAVRRIMRHLITDTLATQYNWLGRGGQKKAFAALKITAAIRGAAAAQNITASECDSHIKNWLKYSSDRSGGRKRRAEEPQSPVIGMLQT